MQNIGRYISPIGTIVMRADEQGLNGLWFEHQRYFPADIDSNAIRNNAEILDMTAHWLDIYFGGSEPDFVPPLHMEGTPFRLEVWSILRSIPYGSTITYGDIAGIIARQRGIKRISAQAVGGAVGRNPISIIVPCHRVIGADGTLTGYAGGIDKKQRLLMLEHSGRIQCIKEKQKCTI